MSRNLSNLRAKQGSFGLPNLHTTASNQYDTLKKSPDHLINTLKAREDFDSQLHSIMMNKATKEYQVRTAETKKNATTI